MTSGPDDDKAPGTLTTDDVKDELSRFKEKLLGMPATVSQMARSAAEGLKPGSADSDATAGVPGGADAPALEVVERLAAIEGRLASVEAMVAEIREHLLSKG